MRAWLATRAPSWRRWPAPAVPRATDREGRIHADASNRAGDRPHLARIMAAHEVVDLTLEEPDIEDIVRRIYRGETGL